MLLFYDYITYDSKYAYTLKIKLKNRQIIYISLRFDWWLWKNSYLYIFYKLNSFVILIQTVWTCNVLQSEVRLVQWDNWKNVGKLL